MLSRPLLIVGALAVAGSLVALASCGSPFPNRAPWGELAPSIGVEGADEGTARLPQAHAGSPAVYLVGYGKRSQFDLDRWLLGLEQVRADVQVFQLATISALESSNESDWLDEETRTRLEREEWGQLVDVRGAQADAFREFTGDDGESNARVMVVDGEGQVEWFGDDGYSTARVLAARATIARLRGEQWTWKIDSSASISPTPPASSLMGKRFPEVEGESLDGVETLLPDALAGEPAVLLIGYLQSTQVDIDRWILGLVGVGVEARIMEIPTIPSFFASLASGWIDDGMRAGIPQEDWSAVVTLYGGSASPVANLTGTDDGRNARVLVLGPDGTIQWFDDGGYAPEKLSGLLQALGSASR